ncbi:MAG: hypothetical protein OXH20_00785 [bacterium]|nr:hypothetical protein [bacterium]MXZ30919.1 hypothetical protein [Acidimicrobiia bacterium]MDE0668041.1 hypothetical protein [bacterium]MYB24398.1 hypothetical protein [Acidimicrobiia bacterium]MYE68123.1 hypothetical protein [Acidimicrobiia bacterium]
MQELSVRGWIWLTTTAATIREKLRNDARGLTTTEWALLVAGVAALAIVVVSVVRNLTSETAAKISTDVNVDTDDPDTFQGGGG